MYLLVIQPNVRERSGIKYPLAIPATRQHIDTDAYMAHVHVGPCGQLLQQSIYMSKLHYDFYVAMARWQRALGDSPLSLLLLLSRSLFPIFFSLVFFFPFVLGFGFCGFPFKFK